MLLSISLSGTHIPLLKIGDKTYYCRSDYVFQWRWFFTLQLPKRSMGGIRNFEEILHYAYKELSTGFRCPHAVYLSIARV